MAIEFSEERCIIIDLESLDENDFKIVDQLPVGFCISFPNSRTEVLEMLFEMRKYGFSPEFIDFAYAQYINECKIISLAKSG